MGHLLYKVIWEVGQELNNGLKGVGHIFFFHTRTKKTPHPPRLPPPPHINNDRSLSFYLPLIFKVSVDDIREIKFDVTWSYVTKRRTAKMTSEFVFFFSYPLLNHIKIEKCPLIIATNTDIFNLLFN